MNITVAKSWQELNPWQLEQIIDIYLKIEEDNFQASFRQMILILFQETPGFRGRWNLRKLLRIAPVSSLEPFGEFLLQPPKLHRFPDVKGLIKPEARLGDLPIKQFSFMDQFFNNWIETREDKMLRALCASIYRLTPEFDELKLPAIAKKTDRLSRKKRQVIAFTYMSCYHHITEQFPVIWKKKKNKEEQPAKVPQKVRFTPFSDIIINVAMGEQQPLGNFHQSNQTRIYDFLQVLTKIIQNSEKQKQEYDKRK